ncbi:hypothetical protein [Metamycoplasma auris]|uniref:Lipoprotein n=1 Tax=Metamycoplasma auris TaxID=51363 RepID=A0A2W7G644_9BACT|nr:hypothetical protein [Metamycoplasma auris]PZW00581.1 hypothetical protein BCF89_10340 [Metamycoplasma auris]
MIKKIALLLGSFVTITPTLIVASCQNSNNVNDDKSKDPKKNMDINLPQADNPNLKKPEGNSTQDGNNATPSLTPETSPEGTNQEQPNSTTDESSSSSSTTETETNSSSSSSSAEGSTTENTTDSNRGGLRFHQLLNL